MSSSWHNKFNWKPENYFNDPQVIALCRAIEADNLAEIDRLVAAGADLNAKGKGNMTPLLWSFPDKKLGRFTRLLEHGADPNVVIESDFNTRGGLAVGDSVTHMACRTEFPGYFEAVFKHGGDLTLLKKGTVSTDTPLLSVLMGGAPNKKAKVKFLIDKGVDLDHSDSTGMTPAMTALGWGGQFDIALMLLEAGADPQVYQENELQKLTHVVVRQESLHLKTATPQQKADYQKLVDWLNEHGESVDEAKADLKRWATWNNATGESQRNWKAEIAARKAKAAEQKAAAEKKPAAKQD